MKKTTLPCCCNFYLSWLILILVPSCVVGGNGNALSRIKEANRGVNHGALRSISDQKLRIDFTSPPGIMPEGANGSPISSYVVEVATSRMQKQTLDILGQSSSGSGGDKFIQGGFKLELDGNTTACIDISQVGVVDEMEKEIKELEFVDSVSVIEASSSSPSQSGQPRATFDLSFSGDFDVNVDHNLKFHVGGNCTAFDPPISIYTFDVQERGVAEYKPEVISVSTNSDGFVGGYFDMSVGFQGVNTRIVSVNMEPVLFEVDPGSRIARCSADVSNSTTPGDVIVIQNEKKKIKKIESDHIVLDTYHEFGTGGMAVPGYGMDNIIGLASIETGDQFLTEINGFNIEQYVEVGDYVKIMDGFGLASFYQVASKSGDTIQLGTTYDGPPITTSIWIRKRVSIPSDASEVEFKQALESLPEIGEVSVTRRGPSPSFGYEWLVNLDSNGYFGGCPESCLISHTHTLNYVIVGGLSTDGNGKYVQEKYITGRPGYKALASSHMIQFEPALEKWEIRNTTHSLSEVQSNATYAPLTGWSNGATLMVPVASTALLRGSNSSVTVAQITGGVPTSFENIIYSETIPAPSMEVQNITISWTEGPIGGFFYIFFRNTDARVKIAPDDSAKDVIMKLELLPSIGSVSVTKEIDMAFSFSWMITFLSNIGDLEMLSVDGEENISGIGASIEISETVKGTDFDHIVDISIPQNDGEVHVARIAAFNAAGKGEYSDSSQNEGGGMHPFAVNPMVRPGRPEPSVEATSSYDFDVRFTPERESDDDIYKLEWSGSGTFGTGRRIGFSLQNSLANDMFGTFKILIKFSSIGDFETSVPVSVTNSTDTDLAFALNEMKSIRSVSVEEFSRDEFGMNWTVELSEDVGAIGDFDVINDRVMSASGSGHISSAVNVIEETVVPEGYDFEYIYPNECSSVTIGESSPLQYISLTAESSGDPITTGSYRISFGGQVSECIPFNATADEVETALLGFDFVYDVDVETTLAPIADQFPFNYIVKFNDLPVNDQWGAIRIDQLNFGSGECEAFDAGINHKAIAFFVKDRKACSKALPMTQVLLLKSNGYIHGSFNVIYSGRVSEQIPVESNASFVASALKSIVENSTTVEVVKKENFDSLNTVAWILKYSSIDNDVDELLVDDYSVTGGTVRIYPLLNFTASSIGNDMTGDVRLHLGNEVTGPISLRATNNRIMNELHFLQGVGSVEMISSGEDLQSISLNAIVENGLHYSGVPVIVIPRDYVRTLAKRDSIKIGSCQDLLIDFVIYDQFDESAGAGSILSGKYNESSVLGLSKSYGMTILGLDLPSGTNFTSMCGQLEGDEIPIQVGQISYPSENTIERLIVMKKSSSDLDTFRVIPDPNWRGTRSQVFAKCPYPTKVNQFIIGDKPEIQRMVFRDNSPNVGQTFILSFQGEDTSSIIWPSGDGTTAMTAVKVALQDLKTIKGNVDVSIVGVTIGEYIFELKFFGHYKLSGISLLSSTIGSGNTDSSIMHTTLHEGVSSSPSYMSHRSIKAIESNGGGRFAFRIAAKNEKGYDRVSGTQSMALLQDGKVPDQPTSVALGAHYTSNSLSLYFKPPRHDGGEEVTKYLVECDSSNSFASTGPDYFSNEITYQYEIQEITLSCTSLCSGSFSLSWGGEITPLLDINTGSKMIAEEISKLLQLHESGAKTIEVSRMTHGFGFKWLVTFSGVRGNIGLMLANDEMLVGVDPMMTVEEMTPGSFDIYPGSYTNEVQSITIKKKNGFETPATGSFTVIFEGDETTPINVDASENDMKEHLEALNTVKNVSVKKSVKNKQNSWQIYFADLGHGSESGAGDIDLIRVGTTSFGDPSVTHLEIFENVKGSPPMAYSLNNLPSGNSYYCRVVSYNALGYGTPSEAIENRPRGPPSQPSYLSGNVDDSSLNMVWSPPADNGGSDLSGYYLDWYVRGREAEIQQITISASDGISEVQVIRTRADSNSLSGYFTLSFRDEETEPIPYNAADDGIESLEYHLRRLSTIGDIRVERKYSKDPVSEESFILSSGTNIVMRAGSFDLNTLLEVGQMIFINEESFNIQAMNETTLTLDATYVGPSSNMATVYTWAYGHEWHVTFTSMVGKQPLLIASPAENWAGVNPSILVKRVVEGSKPLSGTFQLMFGNQKTRALPHDSDGHGIKMALEGLHAISEVEVSTYPNNNGQNFIVTFSSDAGDLPLIGIDDTNLNGPNARAGVSTIQNGKFSDPDSYEYLNLPSTSTSATILGLRNGVPYTVRLSALNSEGAGIPRHSSPVNLIPMSMPSPPTNVQLIPMSDSMMKFVWAAPDDLGGADVITKYMIQWDVSSDFSNSDLDEHRIEIIIQGSSEATFCANVDIGSVSMIEPRYGRVMAFNGHAWSEFQISSPPMIHLQKRTPGEVMDTVAFVTSSIGIMVEWSPPNNHDCKYCGDGGSPITHYVLEWDEQADFSSPASSVVLSPDTNAYHLGGRDPITGAESPLLDNGGTYYLRITAFNSIGSGQPTSFRHHTLDSTVIGPLADAVPSAPILDSAYSLTSTSMNVGWNNPNLDGGSSITSFVVEHASNIDFEHSSRVELPVIREFQSVVVGTENIVSEVHSLKATVAVTNEVQSVRTSVDGADEIQTVTTTCDDVIPEVQTVLLTATDGDEIQSITPHADDIDEIQLVRISGDDNPEIQGVTVSILRSHEVQKLGILISNINTNGANNSSFACYNANVGDPCQEIEDAINGTFTVSFEFDACGGDSNSNFCQSALSKYDPDLGSISCSPGLVSNPLLGGDHCVSQPINHTFSAMEGDTGTLQWALNTLVDDNGKPFMTSLNMPNKQTAVTVTRNGMIKSKGLCSLNSGVHECVGEYEISYAITFDAEHSTGDVPPITIVHSDLRVDENSFAYSQRICPLTFFPGGCATPIGTAMDIHHGNFYDGSSHNTAVETSKGSQPSGMIELDYECESLVYKLGVSYTMTVLPDGYTVSFNDTTYIDNVVEGQWLRFAGDDGIDVYRQILSVNATNDTLVLNESVQSSLVSSDVEFGDYFSDWENNHGSYGVSDICLSHRIHRTLAIDVTKSLEAVSISDWKAKIGALSPIDSTGLIITRHLLTDLTSHVGFQWQITFTKQPGNVNQLTCHSISGTNLCSVETVQEATLIGGDYQLQTTWPHEYVSENPGIYTTLPLRWNIDSEKLETMLESVTSDGLTSVFGDLDIIRAPHVPDGHMRWSGGYTWTITFVSRAGNIPALNMNSSNLTGSGVTLEVSDEDSGLEDTFQGSRDSASFTNDPGVARDGNQVSGSFALSWFGNFDHNSTITGDVFTIQIGGMNTDRFMALSADDMKDLLTEHIFSNVANQIIVTRSTHHSQAMGFTYTVQFIHENVGGDVPLLSYIEGASSLHGQNSGIQIIEQSRGKEIRGTFQLHFSGQTTKPIAYDATAEDVAAALNELSSIAPSAVTVSKTSTPIRFGPPNGLGGMSTQVGGNIWSITFSSHVWKDPTAVHTIEDIPGNWVGDPVNDQDVWESGFSKGWGKNVGNMPLMQCISSGLTTTNGDFPSDGCQISEIVKGSDPLSGSFKLCLDTLSQQNGVISVQSDVCTDNIAHDAAASAVESGGDGSSVEEKLEALENVGDILVTRSDVNEKNGGYTWTIQFLHDVDGPCQQRDSFTNKCNAPGNVPKLCSGVTACETSQLGGSCKMPGLCSKLTVLDATDFANNVRPPSGMERQQVIVKDAYYLGWADGSHVNIPGTISEYKLNINGTETTCIEHNATATSIQAQVQSILDGMGTGKVFVDRVEFEVDAPNGFVYFFNFYDTGNIPLMIPSFTNDTSVCSNSFNSGQEVEVKPIFDGLEHANFCQSCRDGIVQRGNITVFEVDGDALTGELVWNANTSTVKSHLEQKIGRKVQVEMEYMDKYGSCEWIIQFISNPDTLPPGASDVLTLDVQQNPDSSGKSHPVTMTEVVKGSNGMTGSFLLDYGSPMGPLTVHCDEPPSRLQLKLNQLNVVGQVFVTRDCYPSCSEGGWGDQLVEDLGTDGGYMWHIYFVKNPGTSNGFSFPPGSGNINLPSVDFVNLVGNNAVAEVSVVTDGSPPIDGTYKLSQGEGVFTDPIPYNADGNTMKKSLIDLYDGGGVSVYSGLATNKKIPGINATVALDGISLDLQGGDVRKYLAPGDSFRLISDSIPKSFTDQEDLSYVIGTASVSAGSPLLANPSIAPLFVGEKVRIGGDRYSIARNGVEVQQITIHSGINVYQNSSYTLSVFVGGVNSTTNCLFFNATGDTIQAEINNLGPVGQGGVKITASEGSRGIPGDPHVFTIYYIGTNILGNVDEIEIHSCPDPGHDSLPYATTRTLMNGGKIEHQRVSLSADSGETDHIPALKLDISDGNFNSIGTSCIEWGALSLGLDGVLDGAFAETAFNIGVGGISQLDPNLFQITASDYIEGTVIVGDKLQIDDGCIGTIESIGEDGKSVIMTSSTTCSGSPGDMVFHLPDTSVIEVSSGKKEDYSTGLTKVYLSSREPISSGENVFRLEIKFQGIPKQTQCYPYGVLASNIQNDIDIMFDYDGNGIIDNGDRGHIHVSRVGNGDASSSYGYTYSFESKGSRTQPGISMVLGSNSPEIEVVGIGSGVGCADIGGAENLITSSASTVNTSTQISNVSGTDHLLRSGSRIRISGSSDNNKIYTVSQVQPLDSTIILTESFDGANVVAAAEIYIVEVTTPFIFSEEVMQGTNEYNYDIYFVGAHWHDVPLMTVNKFGDGSCVANNTHMTGGMSRNLDVSTVRNGGGTSDSMEYVLDGVIDFTGETNVRLVPPVFTVRNEDLNILRVIVKDEQSSVLWSSNQPAFQVFTSDKISPCIDYNSSEDTVESALEIFCSHEPGCVTVTRNEDAIVAPNGYLFSIRIKGDMQTIDFDVDSTGCSVPFSSADGEFAILEILQGGKKTYPMSNTKLYLGAEYNFADQGQWVGNDNQTFSLYRVTGTYWTIRFDEFLGDKPQLTVSSNLLSSANVTINDSIVPGNIPSSLTIANLKTGVPHYARVYALNEVGMSDSIGTLIAIPGTTPPVIEDLKVQNSLYSNEVQSIAIVASHISEVQVVETSAVAIPEVQEVIIENTGAGSIQNGHFSLRFPEVQVIKFTSSTSITAGSFYLQIDYIDLPASIIQANGIYVKKTLKTPCIPFGSKPEDVKDAMEGNALQDGFDQGSIEVAMSGDGTFSSSFGYEYTIRFVGDSLRGNLPLIKTDTTLSGLDANGGSSCQSFTSLSSDAMVEIISMNNDETIGSDTSRVTVSINADGAIENGQFSFVVSHLGTDLETSCIEWDAEAADVVNALEALDNVDSVRVERRGNGKLSNNSDAAKMDIKGALFLINDSSTSIRLSDSINATMSDFIHVGDRLQFEGQLDKDLFFTVLSISGKNATLDREIDEKTGIYEATSHSNYQYIIYFDGQGLHPHKNGGSPFIPSSNFTVSTNHCSPFETFMDNVLTKYEDLPSVKADVIINKVYNGGSTLPVASDDKTKIITNTMIDALSPLVTSISTLETWEAQDGSITYTLTFGDGDGDLQGLVCNEDSTLLALGGKCLTVTIMDGNMISGHFYLGSSGSIQHDASAQEMESAIEQIPSVTDVEVSRESVGNQGGYKWFITYTGDPGDRDEPVVSNSLRGKHSSITLKEFRKGNSLGGSYKLVFNGESSDSIPFDADESALATAIEMMNAFDSVTVTEIIPRTTEGGRLYHVTFIDQNLGDIDLLEAKTGNLNGVGAMVTIREERKGSLASAEALQISFTPPSGCSHSQVLVGSCGSGLNQVSVQIASDPSFTNDFQVQALLPDESVQIVRISSTSFAQRAFQEPSISGSYRLKYDGWITDDIPISASASDVRNALESLPSITTISVTKDFSAIKFGEACIDLSVGSSLLRCSQSCTCNFGSNGLQGNDLISLYGKWFRVSSTYDGDENEFVIAEMSNSLHHYDAPAPMVNETMLVWGGGFEWRITFHSVQDGLHMLTSPEHHLLPVDSFVHIDTLDCVNCITLNGLEEWKRHFVRVRSSNDFGWGDFSNTIQAVSKSLPDAPSEVSVNTLSSTCIEVSLTPPMVFAGSDEDDGLDIIVEWDVYSDFRSNHHTNYTCSPISNGHCKEQLNGDEYSHFKYEICGLSVGVRYYVRVAAKNSVDVQLVETPHGPVENLKWSSIQSAIPQDQVPNAPQVISVTSFGLRGVQLVFDPPARDGGQVVSHYTIIWDEAVDFSSSTKVDVPVHNISSLSSGEGTNVYTFQPSPSLKQWKTYYLQLEAANSIGSSEKSTPTTFLLTSSPRPPSIGALITPKQSLEPVTHATVSWNPAIPEIPGEIVEGYLIEWWSKRKSPEIQTIKLQYSSPLEHTEFSLSFTTSPTIKKVTAMMPWNTTASLLRRELINLGWSETDDQKIIDNIEVTRSDLINGYSWTVTFGENDHGINYGDQVSMRGDVSSNGDAGTPVLSITTIQDGKRPGGTGEVQFIQLYGTGSFEGFFRLSFGDDKMTPYIAHNATASEIEEALELLPSIGDVSVTQDDSVNQLEIGSTGNLRHHYEVTFLSTVGNVGGLVVEPSDNLRTSNGDASILIVDGNNNVDNIGFKTSASKVGELPVDYQSSSKLAHSNFEYTIEGLVTGREYFVSISAMNTLHGYGEHILPTPMSIIPPIQSPLSPDNVTLSVNTGYSDSLLVTYNAPPSDGGADILRYRVELDPTSNFDNPIIQEIPCPTMNKRTVWQVETKALAGSRINSGSFSLKLSGHGISYDTTDIPYDAVALAQNETGTQQHIDFTWFTLASGNATIFSTTYTSLEGRIFEGDRVRFSNQTSTFKNYIINSVQGYTATLTEVFDGIDSNSQSMSRYYGGRGNPTTSRIYCERTDILCSDDAVQKSGSMQKKLEEVDNVITNGILVDRDGPSSMNEFIWRITFLDDAPDGNVDFTIQPLLNSLTTVDGTNSATVLTSLLSDGGTYDSCTGTAVVPKNGGLVKGLDYYARVSAINSKGYSIPANALNPQAPIVVPGRPTSISLDVISATELRVMFASPIDNGGDAITNYLIEWDTSSSFSNPESTTMDHLTGGSPFFKTIDELTMGQFYFVRVSAWNSEGYGAPQHSSPPSLNPHQPPDPPADVQFAITSNTMLTVGWTPPLIDGGDIIHTYRVEWDTNASFTSVNGPPHKGYIDVDASTDSSYTIQLLSSQKVYFVRVFAINTGGMGPYKLASDPMYLTPTNQVPGKVMSLTVNTGSLSGSLDVHWLRPMIPHHDLPCSGTLENPVACPTNFGDSVTVSNGGESITEYEVEYNERADFGGSDGGRKTVPGTFTTILNLTSGREYYIRVLARNIIGSGAFTVETVMAVAP